MVSMTFAALGGHCFTLPGASHRRSEVNRLDLLKGIITGNKASFPWRERNKKKKTPKHLFARKSRLFGSYLTLIKLLFPGTRFGTSPQ